MSMNGAGVFVVNSAGQPVVASTLITAAAFNAFTADVATALSTAMFKDGQQTPTANIKMGGYKLTNVGKGTADKDAATMGANGNFPLPATASKTLVDSGTAWEAKYPTGYEVVYAEITSSVNAAGTNFAGSTAVVTCGATTFDGTACWMEFYAPQVTNSAADETMTFTLSDGGTDVGIIGRSENAVAGSGSAFFAKRKITPSAIAHTYSVTAYVSANTGTVVANAGTIGVAVPCYLRFTKA